MNEAADKLIAQKGVRIFIPKAENFSFKTAFRKEEGGGNGIWIDIDLNSIAKKIHD